MEMPDVIYVAPKTYVNDVSSKWYGESQYGCGNYKSRG